MSLTQQTFSFLKDIKANNHREWFLKHKDRYLAAKKELEAFAEVWHHQLMTFDESLRSPEEKGYVFRIYRDARFAKGAPYKSNLGILMVKGGRKAMHARAGYYLHVEPGASFLAGGCYMPSSEWLQNIREDIEKNPSTIKDIVKNTAFRKYFKLEGEKVKTTPKGYTKDHPEIELLRHKSFLAMHRLTDQEITGKDFLKQLVKACQALHPFDVYLNRLLP